MLNADLIKRIDEQLVDVGIARSLLEGLGAELSAIKMSLVQSSPPRAEVVVTTASASDVDCCLADPRVDAAATPEKDDSQEAAEASVDPVVQSSTMEGVRNDEFSRSEALASHLCGVLISVDNSSKTGSAGTTVEPLPATSQEVSLIDASTAFASDGAHVRVENNIVATRHLQVEPQSTTVAGYDRSRLRIGSRLLAVAAGLSAFALFGVLEDGSVESLVSAASAVFRHPLS